MCGVFKATFAKSLLQTWIYLKTIFLKPPQKRGFFKTNFYKTNFFEDISGVIFLKSIFFVKDPPPNLLFFFKLILSKDISGVPF